MTEKQRPNLILLPLLPLVGMAWILNKLGQSNYLVKGFAGFMNSPKQKRKAFAGYEPSANVLLLIYGEMKQNPQAIIKQIADWMGVGLTPAQLEKVVEKSSFAYMKANEDRPEPVLSWQQEC